MKVRVIKGFTAILAGDRRHYAPGAEVDLDSLPEAVDWLRAGLVMPLREAEPETATRKAPEKAVTRKSKAKRKKG